MHVWMCAVGCVMCEVRCVDLCDVCDVCVCVYVMRVCV